MAEQTTTAVADDELVVVTIKAESHTHGSIAVLKGSQIEVDKATAEWMLQHDIIEG